MPGPSLNSSPVCQGVAVLLIIITVCKSVCKSRTALGLQANANTAHAHLLKGQLCTFQTDTLEGALGIVGGVSEKGAPSSHGPRGPRSQRPVPSLKREQGEGSLGASSPFCTREALSRPLPALALPFRAHPPRPRTLRFPSVSLSGTHLSTPSTVIAQALRFGPAAQRQAETPDSGHPRRKREN